MVYVSQEQMRSVDSSFNLPKTAANKLQQPNISALHNSQIGRRPASSVTNYPVKGEGVRINIINTSQGAIMRADHVVRDFLDNAHRELGDIVKSASGQAIPIGFTKQSGPQIDTSRLEGLLNRAGLFLEEHSTARADGFGPSLVVREISSEGLKLFEHLRIALEESVRNGVVSAHNKSDVLMRLVEMRANLRSLVHHFDARMLEFGAELANRKGNSLVTPGVNT